ncbi:MAG: Cof-type HAD-IIB family hydrolase [Sporolactobacillus sp.]
MIKLIAIDLDGTLLNPQKEVSEHTRDVLIQAKEKGVRIVLCSGRPLPRIQHSLDVLKLQGPDDYAITYNGGLVQNIGTGKILYERTLTKQDIKKLFDLSRLLNVPMNFLDLSTVYCPPYPSNRPSRYQEVIENVPFQNVDIDALPEDTKINKVVYCIDQEILDQAITQIPDDFYHHYNFMKSSPILLEMVHPEVDKSNGLRALGESLGIVPDEMMTLGDQENDLGMIRFAGMGIAMGNAIDPVKQASRFITKTNAEDGVAFAVEKFIL